MNGSDKARQPPDALARRQAEAIQNAKQAELDRQAKRRRIERARAAMDGKPRMDTLSERKRVARNLWDMLEQFEKGPAGVRKARVMQRALGTNPEDSTKHLPRYALRPIVEAQLGQPELREKLDAKLRKQLVQKIQPYVELARTGAELAGADPDETLLQLLSGTKYLDDKAPTHKRDELAWQVADFLAEHLHAIADDLNNNSEMLFYFDFAERQKLVPHPDKIGFLVPRDGASIQPTSLPFQSPHGYFGKPNDPISLSRLPRIYIGSTQASDSWLGMATAIMSGDIDAQWWQEKFSFPVRCIPTWDVHLIVGPLGGGGRMIPMLSLVARTRVRPAADYEFTGWRDGDDDPQPPLVWRWMTIGEFDGHERQTEFELRGDKTESHYGEVHFKELALSMPRADSEAALAEIEAAAISLNREWAEKASGQSAESEKSWLADIDWLDADHVQADARGLSNETGADEVAEGPEAPLYAETECGPADRTNNLRYSDLPPADWSEFAGLHIDLRFVSADELVDVFTRPTYLRHATTPAIPADLWTDERLGMTAFDAHPLRAPASREVSGTPVLAPEGTLLALLERWWRGEVRNRKHLREEIEETVREAVQRLDAYIEHARESLRGSVIVETPVKT